MSALLSTVLTELHMIKGCMKCFQSYSICISCTDSMRSLFFWSLFQIKIKVQFRSSVFLSDNHWNRNLKRGVGSLSTAQKKSVISENLNVMFIYSVRVLAQHICMSTKTGISYKKKHYSWRLLSITDKRGGGDTCLRELRGCKRIRMWAVFPLSCSALYHTQRPPHTQIYSDKVTGGNGRCRESHSQTNSPPLHHSLP